MMVQTRRRGRGARGESGQDRGASAAARRRRPSRARWEGAAGAVGLVDQMEEEYVEQNRASFGGLVLGCINADFCVQILIFQHFSRSTGFAYLRTARNSNFFLKICEDFEFRAVQRCENLVDLEKRCKMSIWTQKSALIQLRTSFGKGL